MAKETYEYLFNIESKYPKGCFDCHKIVNKSFYIKKENKILIICEECIKKYKVLNYNYFEKNETEEGFKIIKDTRTNIEYVEVPCFKCKNRIIRVLKSEYYERIEYFRNLKEQLKNND
jgi:hypothetical protein